MRIKILLLSTMVAFCARAQQADQAWSVPMIVDHASPAPSGKLLDEGYMQAVEGLVAGGSIGWKVVPVSATGEETVGQEKDGVVIVGFPQPLRSPEAAIPSNLLEWVAIDGQTMIAVQGYEFPGANALRVALSARSLVPGLKVGFVALRDDGSLERLGEIDGNHIEIPGDGLLWSPTVFGDKLLIVASVLGSQLPVPRRFVLQLPVVSIIDLENVLYGGGAARKRYRSEDAAQGTALSHNTGAEECGLDTACYEVPALSVLSKATGLMLVTRGGASGVCTGTLMNNRIGANLFLTAAHCVNTSDSAATLEVFWDYESIGCEGPAPSLSALPRSRGAKLRAFSNREDWSVLELDTVPSGRAKAGSTTLRLEVGDAVAALGHGSGLPQSFALGTVVGFDSVRLPWVNQTNVVLHSGGVAPGHSGSAFVDADGRVRGALSSAPPAQCAGAFSGPSFTQIFAGSCEVFTGDRGACSLDAAASGGAASSGGSGGGGAFGPAFLIVFVAPLAVRLFLRSRAAAT